MTVSKTVSKEKTDFDQNEFSGEIESRRSMPKKPKQDPFTPTIAKRPNRYPLYQPIEEMRLAATLPKMLAPSLNKFGFKQSKIITDWVDIVGERLANASIPERLTYDKASEASRLTIRVRPAIALEMQHLEPVIIERINQFFGYRFLYKISLLQNFEPARNSVSLSNSDASAADAKQIQPGAKTTQAATSKIKTITQRLGTDEISEQLKRIAVAILGRGV